jgi:multidrug efflux pump subunit AcrB
MFAAMLQAHSKHIASNLMQEGTMRAIFSLVGLLLVVVLVGMLAKKQLATTVQLPASAPPGVVMPTMTPGATAAQQSQQIQQQFKTQLDAAMQQARPVEDDK